MRECEFRLDGDGLIHDGARRALTEADRARFRDWIKKYHDVSWLPRNEEQLLGLGRQIHDWLDGDERWLARLRETPEAPVVVGFAVAVPPDRRAREFLEVPWELAADGDGFLARQAASMWAPVRRVGPHAEPLPPNQKNRLGIMFMAAAPIGQAMLDFDAEELAILRATEHAALDLVVEDSGNLDELRAIWHDDGSLDALHLSCHGRGGAEAILVLEGPGGESEKVGLGDLAAAFAAHRPRLLFLSACHTGENDASVDSLALGLVGVGMPAVLAWADAVYDTDASTFAAAFYRQAAFRATSVEIAWAVARFSLLRPGPGRPPPAHWHLARLFLAPNGGGSLAAGSEPRRSADPDLGRKEILDARGDRIEVASRFEFVGRRREIQAIRREFRHPDHAGVLIQGFGRQGKSSLAARIIDRHPELTRVVLFQRCDGPSVLSAIRERVGETAFEICDHWRDRVDPNRKDSYDPEALYHALRALFEVPCRHPDSGKPILLLLDDFEALLDPPVGDGHWRVRPDAVAPLSAIIRAFDRGGTASRLLITSRYEFRLGGDSHDPALRLLAVPLPETSPANRLKQARQKMLASPRTASSGLPPSTERAITAARGNAGLQDLLFQAVLADPATGEATVKALQDHLAGGDLPAQAELRATLENLAIDTLVSLLTEAEHTLLRTSTLFRLPLPLSVWEKFAAGAGLARPERLLAFGLWERLPDIVDPYADAAGRNAIAAARLPSLPDQEAKRTIAALLPDLFAAWGGPDREGKLAATDIELTRLALACGNLDVLASTALFAIRGLEEAFGYREAAAVATEILDALEDGGRVPNIQLVAAIAPIFTLVGDPGGLRRVFANAADLIADDPSLTTDIRVARAKLSLSYGAYLGRQGDPDLALAKLRSAAEAFKALDERREQAVTLNEIAWIRSSQGKVDEALKLCSEALRIFASLGDRGARAMMLDEIAKIKIGKGEIDEALKLLQESLQIIEALGGRRSKAVLLSSMALIMRIRGEFDEGLRLNFQRLDISRQLGDQEGIANASFEIARLHAARAFSTKDRNALRLALPPIRESYRIVRELGHVMAITMVEVELGQVLAAMGERNQARDILQRSLDGLRKLGRTHEAAQVEDLLRQLG